MKQISRVFVMSATAFILALTVGVSTVTAGGSSEKGVAAATTVSIWSEWSTDPQQSAIQDLIAKFNSSHPSVVVEHRPIENEQFFTALRTGFAGGTPPDLFQHEGNDQLFQFVRENAVEDISDFWGKVKDRFVANADAAIRYDGKYFGVPTGGTIDTIIYYNKKILDKYGIDPNSLNYWSDYLVAFKKLKDAGEIPIAYGNKFGWPGSQWFYMFLIRNVGANHALDLVARNLGYKWTDPAVVDAAQMYVDLSTNGYFSAGKASDDWPAAEALFFGGKAAFFQTGAWMLGDYKQNASPALELGLKRFPPIKGKEQYAKDILLDIGGISMSKQGAATSAKRQAGLDFLDYFTALPQAQDWVKKTQDLSAIKGAITAATADPLLLQVVSQLDGNTGSMPFLEHILPKIVGEDKIWTGSVGVLTGQLNAKSWMESVEQAAQSTKPVYSSPPLTGK